MAVTIEATYENGILRPSQPLPLQEHEKVRVTIETTEDRVRRVRETAGLIGWKGDAETLERLAEDPEFGILEAP